MPPSDFEAPYSQLPSSVKLTIVKMKVKEVYKAIAEKKKEEKMKLKQVMLAKAQMSTRRSMHKRSNTLALGQGGNAGSESFLPPIKQAGRANDDAVDTVRRRPHRATM